MRRRTFTVLASALAVLATTVVTTPAHAVVPAGCAALTEPVDPYASQGICLEESLVSPPRETAGGDFLNPGRYTPPPDLGPDPEGDPGPDAGSGDPGDPAEP